MKTVDISGFGGGYEQTCQKMLRNGIEFLKGKPDFDWSGYIQYKNVYGICTAVNEDAKALDDAIKEGTDGTTGAMHQAVIGHLAYVHKNGYEAWLKEAQKHDMQVYELEE